MTCGEFDLIKQELKSEPCINHLTKQEIKLNRN